MFKSLFLKFISVFMVIIFTSFVILISVMTSLVGAYAERDRYSSLQNAASSMSVYVKHDYMKRCNSDAPVCIVTCDEEFQTIIDLLSVENPDCALFVTDMKGKICASGAFADKDGRSFFAETLEDVTIPAEYISQIAAGESVAGDGTMDGIFSSYSLYVGVPIVSGGECIGTVFAGTDEVSSDPITESMMKTLVMSSLWIMLASLIAVYIISERLIRPLKEMSEASKEFAKGNFDCRIRAHGNDEVAQLAESFNNMAESLKNLEYMRSSFVSGVSHELRTPMTSIGGFIDSILDGAIPPQEQRHYLELISSEIKRLSRLVTSLLQISRLESGKADLNFAEFDICEMARMILISNEQRIDEKKLEVQFECDEDNMAVVADKDFIYQVLFNICDNGIKFSREGGKYSVGIHRISGNRAEVSVYNEGVGIPEEDLPYVFDRFYKADKSRGLDKSGVGLGLYIVKCIINNHGQNIRAESEYGKWCRFTFTLALK